MNFGVRDTINIDESVHYIYKQLTDGNSQINSPFRTMKDVFLWAVCLGYLKGNRKKLIGKKLTIFRWSQFSQDVDVPIIKAISLSANEHLEILINQEMCLDILEEYANGSIHYLNSDAYGNGDQPLFQLVENIKSKI